MSLENDIKTEAYFYLDARGTVIKVPTELARYSPVITSWIDSWRKNSKEAFYIDYSPNDVHRLLDKLQKSHIDDFLLLDTPTQKFFERFDPDDYSGFYNDIEIKLHTTEDGKVIADDLTTFVKIRNKIYRLRLFSCDRTTVPHIMVYECIKDVFSINCQKLKSYDSVINDDVYSNENDKCVSLSEIKDCIIKMILDYPHLLKDIYNVDVK